MFIGINQSLLLCFILYKFIFVSHIIIIVFILSSSFPAHLTVPSYNLVYFKYSFFNYAHVYRSGLCVVPACFLISRFHLNVGRLFNILISVGYHIVILAYSLFYSYSPYLRSISFYFSLTFFDVFWLFHVSLH